MQQRHISLIYLVGLLWIQVGCQDSTPVNIINLEDLIDSESDSTLGSGQSTFDIDGGKILDKDTNNQEDSDSSTSPYIDSDTNIDGPADNSTWTLLLYMDADSNLEADMLADLFEVAQVPVPDWLTILVLFDRNADYDTSDGDWTGTRLFKVNPALPGGLERLAESQFLHLSNQGDLDEFDMGNPLTLEAFIDFGQAVYPADYTGLVLSGHGNGWSKKGPVSQTPDPKFICADDSGSANGISIQNELKPLLETKQIDVIGFDACLMGMVEVAWAMKDSVKYIIASEANEASYGWDYYTWLARWVNVPQRSPRILAQSLVEAYRDYHISWNMRPWLMTMAAVDVSKLPAVGAALNELVARNPDRSFVEAAMNFDEYYYYYYDLWDIADMVGDENLKKALEEAVFSSWNSDETDAPGGLSIMFYHGLIYEYQQTSFCKELDWC